MARLGTISFAVFSALLLSCVLGQLTSQYCRDCSLNACISVAKADGGCEACICNGLLMPDCEKLNCTSNCSEQPTLDGCYECLCPTNAPNVCPPIPPCPARCQMQLSSGCPTCTCPEEVTERQCPLISCPSSCSEVTGPDGCPTCECPPPEVVCPQMPACALGCIDRHEEPGYEACLTCNCTIIEELLSENQIIPLDNVETTIDQAREVELLTDTIDPGLVTTDAEHLGPLPQIANGMPGNQNVAGNLPESASPQRNNPPNPNAGNSSPPDYVDASLPGGENPSATSPYSPNNSFAGNSDTTQNPRRQPGVNPNSLQNPTRPRPNDIQCGETSCPPGCTLCIQNDNCGRCLCGEHARICPAVPACPASCIGPGQYGCFTCSCPSPVQGGGIIPTIAGLLPALPSIITDGLDLLSSAEDLFPGSNGRLPPHVTIVRNPTRGPPMRHTMGPHAGQIPPLAGGGHGMNFSPVQGLPNFNRIPYSPQGPTNGPTRSPRPFSPSSGFDIVRNIPPELLGASRFHRGP